MLKKRNRVYRRIAVALTVALLAGQSHAFVLAEEGDVPQTEISSEKTDTDTSDSGSEAGGGSTENGENGFVQGGAANGNTENNGNGNAQGGNTENNNGGADNLNPEENENTGDQQGDGDEQDKCVCGAKCAEGAVNTECPVCAADYAACVGQEKDNDLENGGQENIEGIIGGQECVCESVCTEEAVNAECPVCAADYTKCAQNAGEGVKLPEDEMVLEEDEGIEARAVGDRFIYNRVHYVVTGDGEVELAGWSASIVSGDIKILAIVEDSDGNKYSVTSIGEKAFYQCSELTGVTIPEGVTSIGASAFYECKKLTSVTIPEGVTSIGASAFYRCWNLTDVTIPEGVTRIGETAFYQCKKLTSVTIPESVTSIAWGAFWDCGLTSVTIPEGLTCINAYLFMGSGNLTSVTIPESVTSIDSDAFLSCSKFNELCIVVPPDGKLQFPEVGIGAFAGLQNVRYIRFVDGNGKDITGEAYENAKAAFEAAAANDNDPADNPDDGKWYGWSLEKSGTKDTHKVTITVYKDDTLWTDHGRTFALTKDSGATFVDDLDAVEAGDYEIYDVTDSGNKLNTGVAVAVADADISATVDYYMVTFYDGTTPYETGTSQQPQCVVSGQSADRPAAPKKPDWQFAGWVTEHNGSTPYEFSDPVVGQTNIFASWVPETAEKLHITATATDGGTIAPEGDIEVTKDGEQPFTITPDEGNRIKSVTVDGIDVTAGLVDTVARAQTGTKSYTFTNVTENHTIHAVFEKDDNGGGGDNPNPNPNPNPGREDTPGGGSGGGETKEHSSPAVQNNAGTEPVIMVLETSSPQAESSASAASDAKQSPSAQAANGREPKTGDASYLEVYATLAMIAGLTYLLLYVLEESRGMSEREKEAFVAAFIRWGKKGGAFRKGCAVIAIFCLLAYYHIIGKNVGGNALREKHLGQVF